MRRRFFWKTPADVDAESSEGDRAEFLCDNPEQDGWEATGVGVFAVGCAVVLAWVLLGGKAYVPSYEDLLSLPEGERFEKLGRLQIEGGWTRFLLAIPVGFGLLQCAVLIVAGFSELVLKRVFGVGDNEIRYFNSWVIVGILSVTWVGLGFFTSWRVCALLSFSLAVGAGWGSVGSTGRAGVAVVVLMGLHLWAAAALFYGLPFLFGESDTAEHLIRALVLFLVAHTYFLLGALPANSGLNGPVVRRFWPKRREVWLTIDDGVDRETTPAVLDLLRDRGVKATFFVIGEKAERHPELIERIEAEGHQIGNHTQTHPQGSWWIAMPGRVKREIGDSDAIFRSPVGMSNVFVHRYLQKRNLPLVGWTARGFDGVSTPREEIVEKIFEDVSPGAIILLHEGFDSKERGYSPVDVLGDLLNRLEAEGYACVVPERHQYLA